MMVKATLLLNTIYLFPDDIRKKNMFTCLCVNEKIKFEVYF